jgi:hypothetical protein
MTPISTVSSAGGYQSKKRFTSMSAGSVMAKATGGIMTSDGTYMFHTFFSTDTFTAYTALSVDFLVVAGGGGGSRMSYQIAGSGGGAGGLRCSGTKTGGGAALEPQLSLTATNYPVTIGAGGAQITNGGPSTFSTVTSIGGGYAGWTGRGGTTYPAASGGSGGAKVPELAYSPFKEGGAGTAGQGFAGCTGGQNHSGGGGGAGGPGQKLYPGEGVATSISGTSKTYATGGSEGQGIPSPQAANTGNGGTGGADTGGIGGSGIVIIRYLIA